MTYICHMSDGTELYHHGILGMKWGVRRYQNKDGSLTPQGKSRYSTQTKYGETISFERNRGGVLAKALGKISPKIKEEQDRTFNFDTVVNGKKVGSFNMYRKSDNEMNITWGDTKKSERGKGYMQAAMKLGEQFAKDQGALELTAELIGSSPDIHTVAKKSNFVKVGEDVTQEVMDVWGGLTFVKKKLD